MEDARIRLMIEGGNRNEQYEEALAGLAGRREMRMPEAGAMIAFYAQIKWVHVAAVLLSGGIFLLRGLAMLAGGGWARAAPVRYLSYTVDTILLTAALMLMTIVHQYPFVHGWLTVKVLLLVAYIVIGWFALRPERTRASRLVLWLAALAVYAFIISVARAHHPLGVFMRPG